jgi:hypothetical protein
MPGGQPMLQVRAQARQCRDDYYHYYIDRQSLQSTQKKEGRKGAQTLEKQGKKQPATR